MAWRGSYSWRCKALTFLAYLSAMSLWKLTWKHFRAAPPPPVVPRGGAVWLERYWTGPDSSLPGSAAGDFGEDPIHVHHSQREEWPQCPVGCRFGPEAPAHHTTGTPLPFVAALWDLTGSSRDQLAALAQLRGPVVARSMESATNYPFNDVGLLRRHGFVSMTPQLDSDVPVPYFSYEYEVMRPLALTLPGT